MYLNKYLVFLYMTRGTVNIKFTTFTSFISFPMEIVRLSYPYQNFTEVKIGQNIKNYLT